MNKATIEMAKTTFIVGLAAGAGNILGAYIVNSAVSLGKDVVEAIRVNGIFRRNEALARKSLENSTSSEESPDEEKEETPTEETFKFE